MRLKNKAALPYEYAGQQLASLRKYSLSLTGSSWDADDLAQESWLKASLAADAASHQNPEALLRRIAKNSWIDQGRRKAVWQKISGEMLHLQQQGNAVNNQEASELEIVFHVLVKHMTAAQRAVFMLRDVYGCSSIEAAEILGMTDGAVKAALHRARQALIAVRQQLLQDGLPQPQEEHMKTYVRALAATYLSGDMKAVASLMQLSENDPELAVHMAQRELGRLPSRRHKVPTDARNMALENAFMQNVA
ncbi:RNA polymerase sigma factor [Paenibacillus algorifonticola]|uniref:RNA polymerase sigma factor n=1 Tax=Paenibacillus algorifonticola TaxID=684063 RepID=UPI003D28F16E